MILKILKEKKENFVSRNSVDDDKRLETFRSSDMIFRVRAKLLHEDGGDGGRGDVKLKSK